MKNKLLTTSIILVILTGLSVLFFFVSPSDWISKISLLKGLNNNTSLLVKTKNGKLDVIIDGEEYGETPVELDSLATGKHTIQLTRISTQENVFYEPATILVEITNNTEAIVDIEIGASGSYSGYVLNYTNSPFGDNKAYLTVDSNSAAQAQLDGLDFGQTPTNITEISEKEHKLKITAVGFEDLEIPIQGNKGHNLNVSAYLYPLPININTTINNNNESNSDKTTE